ncbi:MAG TPA: alternative ribosome rescue aminoacyl-tRNA hydrolase ArfB [Thermoanaerobaculia bacterium]|jgi:ribosome-associated protein|nr:alternative ribosome rescue aminoacyl-tRNA hydrolase ArfB [Thermoanaerobaculia bacterium]
MLQIDDRLAIPEEELSFATSRSGGPGGQNVNKLETRVTVRFDLSSPSLDDARRALIRERLATRVSRAGVLSVTSQRHRTQAANREAAVARLVELLRDALAERAARRPTRPGKAARARRLQGKRLRSRRKRERAAPAPEE